MNLVMFDTTIRIDKEGRYCLNDLHKAAIASGLDVERKNPSDFFRNDMAQKFIESLKKVENETTQNLVVVKEGRNGGTYAVRLLAQRYCGWLSSDFEVIVYKTFDGFTQAEHLRQSTRLEARLDFSAMTAAIKYSHEESGEEAKWWHYANECDMINRLAIGMTAKDYRLENNIKDHEAIRDFLTYFQIRDLLFLQQSNTTMIYQGLSFEDRKKNLTISVERFRHSESKKIGTKSKLAYNYLLQTLGETK